MAVKNISPKSESCKPQFTAKRARELFHYEPETGIFRRKIQRSHNACVGDIAGSLTDEGRRIIEVGEGKTRKVYKAHRLAWFYMTGEWPLEVDHKNTDGNDNRWVNLREADRNLNMQNQRRAHKNSSTGVLGVHKQGDKYRARLRVNGKNISLGMFDTSIQASEVYVIAKRQNHGGCTL